MLIVKQITPPQITTQENTIKNDLSSSFIQKRKKSFQMMIYCLY